MNFGALGRELQSRGHRFTFFHIEEFRKHAEAEGAAFRAISNNSISLSNYLADLTSGKPFSLRGYLDRSVLFASCLCEGLPDAFRQAGIDCVLVDILEPGGATAADIARIPFVTICNPIPLHADARVPPDFFNWRYYDTWWARARNSLGYSLRNIAVRRLNRALNAYRRRAGLRSYHRPDDSFSTLAQISQMVPEFDFPERRLPDIFHYVGPYRRELDPETPFPYERLNGRPLVYASLGTGLGGRTDVWEAICQGCNSMDIQLVISLGGQGSMDGVGSVPQTAIVVKYAPQKDLLARADATITHGGLNSMMEILSAAVPVVVLPIYGDQLGVANRVRYHRIGEVRNVASLTGDAVASALSAVLNNRTYRDNQLAMQASITRTRGVLEAADIIEEVLATGKPVRSRSHSHGKERRTIA